MKRKSISVTLAVVAATTFSALGASPAAAVGGCPANRACLYSGKNFTSLQVTTASTNACYWLSKFDLSHNTPGVRSWVNNLPVKVTLWSSSDLNNWYARTTLGAGAFSSDTSVSLNPYWYSHSDMFCMGSAKPR